jgi:hypothetical protein
MLRGIIHLECPLPEARNKAVIEAHLLAPSDPFQRGCGDLALRPFRDFFGWEWYVGLPDKYRTARATGRRHSPQCTVTLFERRRWRDGRFACVKDRLYAQAETALRFSARTV